MENSIEQLQVSLIKHCEICYESNGLHHSTCELHLFCESCTKAYIEYKISEGQVLSLTCPYTNCPNKLSDEFIQSMIPDSLYSKYQELYDKKTKEQNIYFRWCPEKNCSGFDMKTETNKLKCNICQFEFCFFCANKWHEGSKCSGFMEKEFLQWEKKNEVKMCPNCFCITQKNGGCPAISCAKCGISWCWICRQNNNNHDTLKCFKHSKGLNFYWLLILFLVFFPIVFYFVFFVILLLIVIFEDQARHELVVHIDNIIRYKYLYLVTSFFVSPLIMALGLSIMPIAIGILVPLLFIVKDDCKLNFRTVLIVVMFFLGIPLFGIIVSIVFGLVFIIVPLIGISLSIYKLLSC